MFLVTGGGSGIGAALAKALAQRQKPVLIVGRRKALLQEVACFSPLIEYYCADISSANGRQQLVDHLASTTELQGLVNNAALIEPITSLMTTTQSSWRNIMATNVDAVLFLTQCLQKKLQGKRVLNIGSGAAYFPSVGWGPYCVSKAALAMLTRCLQLESKHISFASVMPGIIDTAMQMQLRESLQLEVKKQDFFKKLKDENRLLSPETVALFLCWLLLDVNETDYTAVEWDIYDQAHHHAWLKSPHQVPSID